jgi:hypothetical protein
MIKHILLLTTVMVCLVAGTCRADWTMDFIRITCIPEARYLHVEYKPVNGPAVLMETQFDKDKKKQRLSAWRKHGYYDPSKVEYECRMTNSTYRITSVQPPGRDRGECGVSQSITLSLFRNNKPILDKIIFGDNCFQGPTVHSFEITDGLAGWQSRDMTLCISPKPGERDICQFLSETYDQISKAIPINQGKINKYVEQKDR